MAVKFWLYSSASLLACAGLLWYTYMTRMQFYPAVIYLVTSKISVLILGNTGLVLTILFGRLVKSVFFGTLRDAEVEQILHENVRYAITETCLALTIFRDEINFQVVVLFTSLIFLKVFHWLAQSRIEFIEQTDVVTRLTHVRLTALMSILAAMDLAFVVICGIKVMEMGPTVFILFGFEFLILFITLISIFLRYVLYVIDARMDGNWTNKFTYLFYLELVSEIFKLVIYLVFFMLIFTYYGMPLHIVRDLWMSIKNLQRRIASYFRYRKITANLNERFPNPTEEELQGTDRTCIICREEMTATSCKKLPCSHIFHIDCLKMWVQRQQTCPTCRSNIPTGVRPPVVPQDNAAQPQPPVAQPNAAAPAPPAAPAAPARVPNVAPVLHHVNPVAPAQPTTPANPASQTGGTPTPTPVGAPAPQFPPGYPSPFMSPMMFGPGIGSPFGYGFPPGYGTIPPFGFYAPGHAGTSSIPDSTSIQRQIELLQSQLAALQAATQAYGMQFPGQGAQFPVAPPVPPSAPQTTHQAQSQPNVEIPAVPVPTPTSASMTDSSKADDLEEKAPIPADSTPPSTDTTEGPTQVPAQQPVETPIPATLTEAERRREELRRRYNRIYSSTSQSGDGEGDEQKKNE